MYRPGITGLLSNPDNWKLREKLAKEFPLPQFKLIGELKAPALTSNRGVVGMGFEYILYKRIQVLNKNCESRILRPSINDIASLADYILNRPIEYIPIRTGNRFELLKEFNSIGLWPLERKDTNRNAKFGYHRQELNEVQIAEKCNRFYTFLEIIGRSRYYEISDIMDIISLITLVNDKLFITEQKCFICPSFGETSIKLGAQADLIIGNTLIDIKTTVYLNVNREYFNQLICYYILSLIGGVNENPQEKPIENIGIYFARYGILWTMPISEIGDSQKFESFRKWFISFLRKSNIADLRGIYKHPINE